jgi:TRAP-type C4-dicarboxylate transport system permease small subunit
VQELVNKTIKALHALENGLLALLLGSMIGVAALQVIMRNFMDSGLYWGDSAVRVMVLWVAMLGAMIASRTDDHIRIDLVNQFLPEHIKQHARRVINLFTLTILVLFTWSSAVFVGYEFEDQTIAFGEVPAWWCEVIMPIGAGVMSIRYALQVIWPKP